MKYHILILGPETIIGQKVILKLIQQYSYLQVAVIAKRYPPKIILPPNQIAVESFDLPGLVDAFLISSLVLSCDPKYSTQACKTIIQDSQSQFIDGCVSHFDVVLRSLLYKLPFKPNELVLEKYVTFEKFFSFDIWTFSHSSCIISRPVIINDEILIQQPKLTYEDKVYPHQIRFTSLIMAYIIWFFALILKLFPKWFGEVSDNDDWEFRGIVEEHEKNYEFSGRIKADWKNATGEIAVIEALNCLNLKSHLCYDDSICQDVQFEMSTYNAMSV